MPTPYSATKSFVQCTMPTASTLRAIVPVPLVGPPDGVGSISKTQRALSDGMNSVLRRARRRRKNVPLVVVPSVLAVMSLAEIECGSVPPFEFGDDAAL